MASATRLGGEADDVLDAANIAGYLTEDDARTFGLLQAWRDERLLTPVDWRWCVWRLRPSIVIARAMPQSTRQQWNNCGSHSK
jgi:hypothetical protein